MPFKDYSNTPASNTELEGPLFIGPNMDRNNVRPALQQLAADGRELYDEMIALGGGGGLPAFIAAGTGALTRTAQDKFRDEVNVWDFMTDAMKASVIAGNLAVDTAPAFQAALDYASGKTMNSSGHGRKVRFRGGTYRWDTPVTFTWRVASAVIDAGDMRRPTLEGDGSANTTIFYTGSDSTPALSISGYSSGANGGVDLFMQLRGFWLRRAFASVQTGTGIKLDQIAYVSLDDVGVDQFATNLDILDTIRLHATGCRISGATTGLFARVSVFSHPNVFAFERCDFGGNFKTAAKFTTPANVSFDTCGFEGCGDGTLSGGSVSDIVRIDGGPQEGGCAAAFRNCYFENSWARSEVFLNWSAANNSGTVVFEGCSFNKTGNTRIVTNHVLVSAETPSTGKLKVSFDGCAFKGFSYTPSADRPVVAQTSISANALLDFRACHYDSDLERPQLNGWPALGNGYEQLAASVRFTSSGTMESEWNVGSVSKTNTGTYAITYKQPLRVAAVHMTFGKIGSGVTHAYVDSETTTGCVIVTTDAAGAAADRAVSVELRGLLN